MSHTPENTKIFFITGTQYQFLVADIYARYIYDKYNIRSTVIHSYFPNFDISRFNTNGKYTLLLYTYNNKNVIGKCIFSLQCGYLFPFSKWKKLFDSDHRIITFIFTDLNKLADRLADLTKQINENNLVYLIEEGNLTYEDPSELRMNHEKLWYIKHKLTKILFGIERRSKVIGDNPLIDGVIVKNPERYGKLEKSKGKQIIQQDKDIMLLSGDFAEHYGSAAKDLHCDILYLGDPHYRNGKYFEAEDECISSILSAIPSELSVLLKPHPRDLIEKYDNIIKKFDNVRITDEETAVIPIEPLIEIVNPKAVIAIESTATITLANMYPDLKSFVMKNIPEASVMFEKLIDAGEEVPHFGDDVYQGENDNIFIPDSLEELHKMLREIAAEPEKKLKLMKKHSGTFDEIDMLLSSNAAQVS